MNLLKQAKRKANKQQVLCVVENFENYKFSERYVNEEFYTEIDCIQRNHQGERICGDVFLTRKLNEENRVIIVLSDGMGHGVKANILATLTATMALNFTVEHKEVERIADIIMNTLPVCDVRKMSYSTFTIIDIENDGFTTILEYDNPGVVIMKGNKPFYPKWKKVILESEKNPGKELRTTSFTLQKRDRIVFFSDGVAQSGMGSRDFPFGWGKDSVEDFIEGIVNREPTISATELSMRIINRSHRNDGYKAKDDTSCGCVFFREPRKLLICTGPPYDKDKDKELADLVKDFKGKKIIMGATTSDILARELNKEIEDSFDFIDDELPPISFMEGFDLVTEGILTLNKVERLLKQYQPGSDLGKGPADQVVKLIKDCDEIHFVIGTCINIAHQDPNLPVELEIRRTVVKRLTQLLHDKFLKEVTLRFI